MRTRFVVRVLVAAMLPLAAWAGPAGAQTHLLHVDAGASRAAPAFDIEPDRVWRNACASCHGADGAGRPAEDVAFEEELPSLRDCEFAPREADADWFGIVHDGGPARAFSRMMPAFGDALTDAEIQAAIDRIRDFCADRAWPRGELNFPLALRTEKAFPEDEAVVTTAIATESPASVMNQLVYEQRIGPRAQIEMKLPFGWREDAAGTRNRAAAGDLTLGLKYALLHGLGTGSIVSFALETKLPTGEDRTGFGAGTTIFEPWLAYGQMLPAGLFLQGQGGVELPADRDRSDEAFWRVVLGRTFTVGRFGRAFSPMAEVTGARELARGASATWDFVPQMQITLSRRQHVRVNLGVAVPLTETAARSPTVHAYLLWDWFDGMLTEGW
jgi:hypothetical protein